MGTDQAGFKRPRSIIGVPLPRMALTLMLKLPMRQASFRNSWPMNRLLLHWDKVPVLQKAFQLGKLALLDQ